MLSSSPRASPPSSPPASRSPSPLPVADPPSPSPEPPVEMIKVPQLKPVVMSVTDMLTGPGAENPYRAGVFPPSAATPQPAPLQPVAGAGAIAPAPFVFPQALKKYSPIQSLLNSNKTAEGHPLKPIVVILSGDPSQVGVPTLEKSLREIKEHVESSGEKREQKIIFIRNTGDHWTVHERSTANNHATDHRINGNGYCGLTSAIVASELINGQPLPEQGSPASIFKNEGGCFNILTEHDNSVGIENKDVLLKSCFGDSSELEEGSLKKLAHDAVVKLIDNNGASSIDKVDENGNPVIKDEKKVPDYLWLSDLQIMEVIKHRSKNKFVYLEENCHESLPRTPHFERKVAFLKYLDSPGIKISDFDKLDELTLSELLFDSRDKSKYDPDRVKLCLKVLNKFIDEIAPEKVEEKKEKLLDFYKLMEDVSRNAETWTVSMDDEFLKIQKKFDSLGNLLTDEEEYERLNKDIKNNLEAKSASILSDQKKIFLKELKENKSTEDLQEFQDFLKEEFDPKKKDTFKDRINKLLENAFSFNDEPLLFDEEDVDIFGTDYSKQKNNKEALKTSFTFLARRDPDFIPAIIPDRYQLNPQKPFKGWGKKIEFKEGGKIFIDDKEVEKIFDTNGKDIIGELRQDFKGNDKLFNLAVIDFFRRADEVTLKYVNNDIPEKLENNDRKTLKCDGQPGKSRAVNDSEFKDDEMDTQELLKGRVESYSKAITATTKATTSAPAIKDPPAGPPGADKGGVVTKKDMLEEIKKHLDNRFILLDEVLKKDKDAIVVIPGFIDKTNGTEVYSLGTGLAKTQWGADKESQDLLEDCKNHIETKINALKAKHSDKILLGNIGDQISSDASGSGYFLPQFPIWDQPIYDYTEDTKMPADPAKKIEAEQRLIESYESMCRNLSIVTPIDGLLSNEDKIKAYQKILFQDDPPPGKENFKRKKFIHVWGANSGNFNNNMGDKIDGEGQATAFKGGQQFGIFGIVTTPLSFSENDLRAVDKMHKKGGTPAPSPGGAIAGGVPGVEAGAAALN